MHAVFTEHEITEGEGPWSDHPPVSITTVGLQEGMMLISCQDADEPHTAWVLRYTAATSEAAKEIHESPWATSWEAWLAEWKLSQEERKAGR